MSGWLILGLYLVPSSLCLLAIAAAAVRCWFEDRDAKRRACQYRHVTKVTPAESFPLATVAARIAPQAEAMRTDLDSFARLCGELAPTAAEIEALKFFSLADWTTNGPGATTHRPGPDPSGGSDEQLA